MNKLRIEAGSTGYIIIAEILYALLGVVLLLVPGIELIHICYGLSILLVFAGIVLIVRYFMTESYRNLNEYGFSIGILGVILGMCALVRAQLWVKSFLPVLGIALLLMAVTKLQYAMDLKSMKDQMWILVLVVAVLLTSGAVCVVINPFKGEGIRQKITCYLLILDGILGVVGNLYLYIRLRLFKRAEDKNQAKPQIIDAEEMDDIPDNFDTED